SSDLKKGSDKVSFDFNGSMTTEKGCMREDGSDPYYLENTIPGAFAKIDRFEATQRELKLYAGKTLIARMTR
ncbi:MAG: hypothetical protein AAF570_18030, partial [Bacteroidota bacterium]